MAYSGQRHGGVGSSSRPGNGFKGPASSVEFLGRGVLEMQLSDAKADADDERDIWSGSDVTDNSSNEASHIKSTTIGGHSGLPKQVRVILLQFLVYIVSGIEKNPDNNKLLCKTVGHIHC